MSDYNIENKIYEELKKQTSLLIDIKKLLENQPVVRTKKYDPNPKINPFEDYMEE